MRRFLAAWSAACIVLGGGGPVRRLSAQTWNDERTRALVKVAVARRARQLADTALADYRATAHGYLTFLAQLGGGDAPAGGDPFTEPPKVVRSDQLALEIFWRAPSLSKQRIIGRRDTLLLPTDINYHRDHLGIVQNNFPDIIRLGEGDEVRDVPHPLSDAGLADYDFAITDSLRMRLPGRTIEVYEVRVRPRDDRAARLVGTLYIERATAQVVRMAFSFTRAALLDRELEDISVVLENGLVEGRFWLPYRQEIEIRRTGTWLDYPARGIIRGRWEICCYQINTGLDSVRFSGPEIVSAPPAELHRYPWTGAVLDSLPTDVRAFSDDDIMRVKEEARTMIRAQALARGRETLLSARGISDFVRVNRVEGLAAGGGVSHRLGHGWSTSGTGRWGFEDRRAKGSVFLGWEGAGGVGAQAFVEREYRDAGDVREASGAINSIAAQEFGADRTDPFEVRAAGLRMETGVHAGFRWRAEASRESQGALLVHAVPATRRYEGTLAAWDLRETRAVLHASRAVAGAPLGFRYQLDVEARAGWYRGRDASYTSPPRYQRLWAGARAERPLGDVSLEVETTAGAAFARGDLPPQDYLFAGGPVSLPGYAYHGVAGRTVVTQRVELRLPMRFVGIRMGRFGSAPATAHLAPFIGTAYVDRAPRFGASAAGWYPTVGVGALMLFDLVRVDVARGLRRGRWTFSADVSRDLWGVL